MPGGRDVLSTTQRDAFGNIARVIRGIRGEWTFSTTAGSGVEPVHSGLTGVIYLGQVEEPWDLLCSVRALALLTPFGYGFKTTIADALAAGCHVLVHKKLLARLPVQVASHCIGIDPWNSLEVIEAFALLSAPPRHQEANAELRRIAAASMRQMWARESHVPSRPRTCAGT